MYGDIKIAARTCLISSWMFRDAHISWRLYLLQGTWIVWQGQVASIVHSWSFWDAQKFMMFCPQIIFAARHLVSFSIPERVISTDLRQNYSSLKIYHNVLLADYTCHKTHEQLKLQNRYSNIDIFLDYSEMLKSWWWCLLADYTCYETSRQFEHVRVLHKFEFDSWSFWDA